MIIEVDLPNCDTIIVYPKNANEIMKLYQAIIDSGIEVDTTFALMETLKNNNIINH